MTEKIANLPDNISLIYLGRGNYAIVDTKNLRTLSSSRWCLFVQGDKRYARRYESGKNGGRKTIFMHREILNTPDGFLTDHVNGNGLDNRETNLRVCTRGQNRQNSLKKTKASSKYKGVYWQKSAKKWKARLTFEKKSIYLGLYQDEKIAAKAYDQKAIELFGEFANLNFPVRDG